MQTLSQFLLAFEREFPEHQGLKLAIEDIAKATIRISDLVGRGALIGIHGEAGETNIQGESQQQLDILSNQIMLDILAWSGNWAGLASEEMENIYHIPARFPKGKYLCAFDPLDGSGNIDINMPIGTIFSVLPFNEPDAPHNHDFLRAGNQQIAAGYALYGACTMLTLTLGHGVHRFTFDRSVGEYFLTKENIQIPKTPNYAINQSNFRHWEPPIQQYIENCLLGDSGGAGCNYNMRWMGCMIADCHKILEKGGVFLYPADKRDPNKPSKLRLLYEVNPMAFVFEQAGGKATTGTDDILSIQPMHLHQRVPAILGHADEINHIIALHEN